MPMLLPILILNGEFKMNVLVGETLFVLTPKMYSSLKTRGYGLVCTKCGKELKEGEAIVSKNSGKPKYPRKRHFHAECFKSLYIDLDKPMMLG